jgi:hypothetical protein
MSTFKETVDPDSGETPPEGMVSPFPDPGETPLDHAAISADRLAFQYRQSPKLQATIAAHAALAQTIEDVLVGIGPLDDPDTVHYPDRDTNLDVTGELVGQSRVLANGTVVSDALYRIYIAMRKLRNASIGSGPQYVAALETIFGSTAGTFRFGDIGGMTVIVEIANEPTDDQKALMDDTAPVPRAMGVGTVRVWFNPSSFFAFDADPYPGAKGFGELGDPTQGGQFAELF